MKNVIAKILSGLVSLGLATSLFAANPEPTNMNEPKAGMEQPKKHGVKKHHGKKHHCGKHKRHHCKKGHHCMKRHHKGMKGHHKAMKGHQDTAPEMKSGDMAPKQ